MRCRLGIEAITLALIGNGAIGWSETYKIERHTSVALTDARADAILGEGRNVLLTKESDADVSCDVKLTRDGAVSTFADPKNVNSSAAFNQVCAHGANIHVVASITWCGKACPDCIGCSSKPGSCVVVVRYTESLEGQLWMHEYGHNKGLPDVKDPVRVMNESLSAQSTHVTQAECSAYTSRAAKMASASKPEGQKVSVEEFVRRNYVHGVPYDEASRFGTDAVPPLLKMLDDKTLEQFWPSVAVTLGIIGDPRGRDALIAQVKSGTGIVSRNQHIAKVSALVGLGYLVQKSKDATALAFLTAGLKSAGWRGELAWLSPLATSVEERRDVLFSASAQALGLTGTEQAAEALTAALDSTKGPLRDVLTDAIAMNVEVTRLGEAAFRK